MKAEPSQQRLQRQIERQIRRRRRADDERRSVLGQTVFLGTLGLLFVLPLVGLTYLGVWIDGLAEAYSSRWTVSLMLLGLCIGAVNVYLYIREHP
ncbi:AtpZ/AtpI family protein [Fontimonas sp. SYSU GA230001]|uniref:AtpZ/AtpI family protein n=1 Tax=Fontimonas sp. SYSU GA230001 TaxID=3142450 RepID=UPI0032B392D4